MKTGTELAIAAEIASETREQRARRLFDEMAQIGRAHV